MKKNYFIIRSIAFCFVLCAFNSFAQAPSWQWAKNVAGFNSDKSFSIAVDVSGNSFITGSFLSTAITLGSATLTNSNVSGNTSDLFFAKYDPSGNLLWARSAGGIRNDESYTVAVDASGNSFITGYFESAAIVFGTITLTNDSLSDAFVVKYDPAGNVLWAKSVAGKRNDYGNSISLDAVGNAYAVGNFESDSIVLGATTLMNADGINATSDIFLVKYDPSGNVLWAENTGGAYTDVPNSISTDAAGNSYVAGYFSDGTTIGSTTMIGNGYNDLFLAKFDASGNSLWATSAGGAYGDVANSIAFDASGNSYVAGYFVSPAIVFGSTTLNNVQLFSRDLFIAKYDPSGNVLWAESAGVTKAAFATSIATDFSGNIFVTGNFSDPAINIGAITLNNHDVNGYTTDIFLAKIDPLGNTLWAKNENADIASSVAVDAVGNGYVTGYFDTLMAVFGSDTLVNVNSSNKIYDIFIAKIGKDVNGINSFENSNNAISVFPNPSSGIFHLEMNNGNFSKAHIEIYDVLGNIVFTSEILNSQAEIDLTKNAKGIYFYRVMNGAEIIGTGKIIVR